MSIKKELIDDVSAQIEQDFGETETGPLGVLERLEGVHTALTEFEKEKGIKITGSGFWSHRSYHYPIELYTDELRVRISRDGAIYRYGEYQKPVKNRVARLRYGEYRTVKGWHSISTEEFRIAYHKEVERQIINAREMHSALDQLDSGLIGDLNSE